MRMLKGNGRQEQRTGKETSGGSLHKPVPSKDGPFNLQTAAWLLMLGGTRGRQGHFSLEDAL